VKKLRYVQGKLCWKIGNKSLGIEPDEVFQKGIPFFSSISAKEINYIVSQDLGKREVFELSRFLTYTGCPISPMLRHNYSE